MSVVSSQFTAAVRSLRVRPKRLRFLVISMAGRVVQHARKTLLKQATEEARILLWIEGLKLLPIPA